MPGPNYITQAELDDLRQQQKDLIAEIGGFGDIKRQVFASNNKGGQTRTLQTIGTNVPMRLWISSGPNGTSSELRFWGEQELSQTDAFVILYWDQDIAVEDVIIYDNSEWRVLGLAFNDTFRTAKRLRVARLR